jgi:hypothetical protein
LFKAKIKLLEWKLFYLWILATTLAWTINGMALIYANVSPLCLLPIIGFTQWYVLEYYLPKVRWWIWTNILGVSISGVIITALLIGGVSQNIVAHPLFSGTLTGIFVGILQWFFLRQRVSKAGWWILANIVGVALGKAISFGASTIWGSFLELVFGGLVFGGITGFLLIWLLQYPLSESKEPVHQAIN